MIMARFRLQILSAFLIAVTAFAPAPAFSGSPKKSYKKALKAWTHEDELYQREDFYASMKWTVTYLSPEFMAAQADMVSDIYDHSPTEKARYVRQQRDRFGGYEAFFVSFYGYDYKTADLAKKDSIWRLRLEENGREVAPSKFEEIRKPTPFDIQLYPYINTWSRHYFVYFPKAAGLRPGETKLKINGPYSRGELAW